MSRAGGSGGAAEMAVDEELDDGSATATIVAPRPEAAAVPVVAVAGPAWTARLAAWAGVALTPLAVTGVALRLWQADLRVPLAYAPDRVPYAFAADANFYLMLAKDLLVHGTYLHNPDLGAPLQQRMHDFPQGADQLQMLALWVLGRLTGDAVLAVNLWWLATFPLVALSAYACLRLLGRTRLVAAVLGVLYSLLPYHFARGTPHLFLSAYFMVPVGVVLVVRVLSPRPPFTRGPPGARRWSLRGWGNAAALGACVLLASTGAYYALMTMALVALTALVQLARGDRQVLASACTAVGAIGLALGINLSPSMLWWAGHGLNDRVANRPMADTEILGLKLYRLLEPVDGHRVGWLRDIARAGERTRVPSERGQQLGLVGALGLVGLLGAGLGRVLGGSGTGDRRPRPSDPVPALAGVALLAVLLSSMGGLAVLASQAGISPLRSWNRMSVVLGFAALAAVGVWLDRATGRLPRWRGRAVPAVALVLAVGVAGVLDQVSPAYVPDHDANRARWASDAAFGREVQALLPAGSMVYVLPWTTFPEAGLVGRAGPYDGALGWLHTDGLRWSWGAMRGRDGDWHEQLARRPVEEQATVAAAAGFRAVWLDTWAAQGSPLEADLHRVLGPPLRRSADGRFALFGLPAAGGVAGVPAG